MTTKLSKSSLSMLLLTVLALAYYVAVPSRTVPTTTSSSFRIPVSDRNVETTLPGSFWPTAKSKYMMDFDWFMKGGMTKTERLHRAFEFFFMGGMIDTAKSLYGLSIRTIPITVYDARAKEAEEGLSKAEFFEKYGFVILDAPSAMTAEDWIASERDIPAELAAYNSRSSDGGAEYNQRMHDFRNANTPVKQIYAEEAKELIQSILPRAKTIMPPAKGIRRSFDAGLLGGKAPAKTVHNDYGLEFDEIVERNPFFDFHHQKKLYEETMSDEYMLINLWRPIKPMSSDQPLRSLPLCFLDSSTLSEDDIVTIDSMSLGITTGLKENPNHKFYYFPDMTVDEVVVFKQFHTLRNEEGSRMPVFHTAFPDPAADETTEGRVSFEYRVGLLA